MFGFPSDTLSLDIVLQMTRRRTENQLVVQQLVSHFGIHSALRELVLGQIDLDIVPRCVRDIVQVGPIGSVKSP